MGWFELIDIVRKKSPIKCLQWICRSPVCQISKCHRPSSVLPSSWTQDDAQRDTAHVSAPSTIWRQRESEAPQACSECALSINMRSAGGILPLKGRRWRVKAERSSWGVSAQAATIHFAVFPWVMHSFRLLLELTCSCKDYSAIKLEFALCYYRLHSCNKLRSQWIRLFMVLWWMLSLPQSLKWKISK